MAETATTTRTDRCEASRPRTIRSYHRDQRRKRRALLGLLVLIIVLSLLSLSLGVSSIGPLTSMRVLAQVLFSSAPVDPFARLIVLDVRLPRVLMAMIAGAGLGTAGALMQGALRNPLVSPFTLGMASASAFGAGLAIVLGVGVGGGAAVSIGVRYMAMANAFVFSTLVMVAVLALTRLRGTTMHTIILAGVAVGYLFQGGLSILHYIADSDALRELTYWLMGGVHLASMRYVLIILPVLVLGLLFSVRLAWDLNALSTGDEVAESLGTDVRRVRAVVLLLASLLTATVISITGVIGFIGLVSPHLCRLALGGDGRYVVPASALVGAIVLVAADTAVRLIVDPIEMPVGILTSLIGLPFFVALIIRRRIGA